MGITQQAPDELLGREVIPEHFGWSTSPRGVLVREVVPFHSGQQAPSGFLVREVIPWYFGWPTSRCYVHPLPPCLLSDQSIHRIIREPPRKITE